VKKILEEQNYKIKLEEGRVIYYVREQSGEFENREFNLFVDMGRPGSLHRNLLPSES
jgi:hypothetical protein